MTFDSSIDISVAMQGTIGTEENLKHKPLADLMRFVADYAGRKKQRILALAEDVMKVSSFIEDNRTFDELDAQDRYDGIWACASILHLPRTELAEVIRKLEKALKYGGVLYTSFKYGEYEGMRNGRYFTDFTEESLKAFWHSVTDLQIFDTWRTQDVRSDRKERQWINLLARRV